jgi:hypothetical protein
MVVAGFEPDARVRRGQGEAPIGGQGSADPFHS